MTNIFVQIFVFQVIIIGIIVFFLRKTLLASLAETAIHQFEVMFAHDLDQSVTEIEVTVFGELSPAFRERIAQAAQKKFKRTVDLSVKQDRAIKGGLIIRIGATTIDGSLRNRLKETGWGK